MGTHIAHNDNNAGSQSGGESPRRVSLSNDDADSGGAKSRAASTATAGDDYSHDATVKQDIPLIVYSPPSRTTSSVDGGVAADEGVLKPSDSMHSLTDRANALDDEVHVSEGSDDADEDPKERGEGGLVRQQSSTYKPPPTFNKSAIVSLEGQNIMVDVSRLFVDDCTTQGNCSNKFLGLKDVKYWDSRYAFGVTRLGYNSLAAPLGVIHRTGKTRRTLVAVVDSLWFSRFVITAILCSSITLAVDAATLNQDNRADALESFLRISEYIYLATFTLEALLKVTAMGFINHTDSYMMKGVRKGHRMVRQPNWWNIIDCMIVVLAWVGLHPSVANVNIVRALLLMRPLKALHSVEGLQIILKALVSSMGPLANVVVLLMFFMIMFAITGVLIWEGQWHQRCYIDMEVVVRYAPEEELLGAVSAGGAALLPNVTNTSAYNPYAMQDGGRSLDDWTGWENATWMVANVTNACTRSQFGRHCNIHDTGMTLPSVCEVQDWRRKAYLNFDNTLTALLLVFKVISLDDWPDDMTTANDTVGQFAFIYFLAVTLFGSFFTMNLVLAILCGDFAAISAEIREEKERERHNEKLQLYKYKVNLNTIHFNYMRLIIAVYGAGMRLPQDDTNDESIERIASVFEAIKDSIDRSAALRSQTVVLPSAATQTGKRRRLGVLPFNNTAATLRTAPSLKLPPVPIVQEKAGTQDDDDSVPTTARESAGTPPVGLNGSSTEPDVVADYKTHGAPSHFEEEMRPVRDTPRRGVLRNSTQSVTATPGSPGSPASPEHGELLGKEALLHLIRQDQEPHRGSVETPRADLAKSRGSSGRGSLKSYPSDGQASPTVKTVRIEDEPAAAVEEVLTEGSTSHDHEDREDREEEEEGSNDEEAEEDEEEEEEYVEDDDDDEDCDSDVSSSTDEEDGERKWYEEYNKNVKKVVNWRWFNRFVVLVITFNVVVMCMDHHGISPDFERFLELTSFVCNLVFILEMILKMVGLSIKGYFSDGWNRFDFVLVMVSIPEMVIAFVQSDQDRSEGTSGVTALRALRAFRVTRLLRRYKSLQRVVTTIMRSLSSAVYLCLIMLLFIFVYSVLGVQLFMKSFPAEERNNFGGLWQSAITVFVVITGEKWATTMHIAMEETTPAAAIYFISLFSLGNYIFMNLFIAILIENFAHQHYKELQARKERAAIAKARREARRKKKKAKEKVVSEMARRQMMRWDSVQMCDSPRERRLRRSDSLAVSRASLPISSPRGGQPDHPNLPKLDLSQSKFRTSAGSLRQMTQRSNDSGSRRHGSLQALSTSSASLNDRRQSISGAMSMRGRPVPDAPKSRRYSESPVLNAPLADPGSERRSFNNNMHGSFRGPPNGRNSTVLPPPGPRGSVTPNKKSTSICDLTFASFDEKDQQGDNVQVVTVFKGKSLFIFGVDNPIRVFLTPIVTHKAFDWGVLFIIFCNTVTLSLEGPWTQGEARAFRDFLDVSDIVFVVLFSIEALMKIIVYGFVGDDICGRMKKEREKRRSKRDSDSDNARLSAAASPRSPPESPSSPHSPRTDDDVSLSLSRRTSRSSMMRSSLTRRDDSTTDHDDETNEEQLLMQDKDEELCPYIWSPWNRVDFVVLVTAILGIFIPFFALFRSLRSLRLIIRNQNIKVVVRALFHALPAIGNVLAITSFVFIVFSILGVQLFKGKFYYCTDPVIENLTSCVGQYTLLDCAEYNASLCPEFYCEMEGDQCVTISSDSDIWGNPVGPRLLDRQWENSRFNFDNLGESFLTLFQVSFAETWADILWLGVDARSVEDSVRHPSARDANPWNALFFIGFMVVGNFFALNLFIGLLIDRFTMLRREIDGSAFLTEAQTEWVKSQKNLSRIKLTPRPLCPTQPVRQQVFMLVSHENFDRFVMVCICANVIVMSLRHYEQPHTLEVFEQYSNLGFVCLFALEAVLKILAYGRLYFQSGWNRFDFFLVVVSGIGLVVGTASLQVFRILRVARILRLIKKAQGLAVLFGTLYYALPSLLNIGLLLLCVYFNFAVVGVQLFGEVRDGPYLDKWMNFRNLGSAIITLYTISTTEKWNDVMEGVMTDHPGCHDQGDCGANRPGSIIYFCLFMVIGGLITLNLFITVVLENFNEQQKYDSAQEALSDFKESWRKYDKKCVGWLQVETFLNLLKEAGTPVGLHQPDSAAEMVRHLRFLAIPVSREGTLRYCDAMRSISKMVLGMGEEDMPVLKKYAPTYEEAFTVFHWYVTVRIKRRWRNYVRRRKIATSALASIITLLAVCVGDRHPQPPPANGDASETDDDADADGNDGDDDDTAAHDSTRNEPFADPDNSPFAGSSATAPQPGAGGTSVCPSPTPDTAPLPPATAATTPDSVMNLPGPAEQPPRLQGHMLPPPLDPVSRRAHDSPSSSTDLDLSPSERGDAPGVGETAFVEELSRNPVAPPQPSATTPPAGSTDHQADAGGGGGSAATAATESALPNGGAPASTAVADMAETTSPPEISDSKDETTADDAALLEDDEDEEVSGREEGPPEADSREPAGGAVGSTLPPNGHSRQPLGDS